MLPYTHIRGVVVDMTACDTLLEHAQSPQISLSDTSQGDETLHYNRFAAISQGSILYSCIWQSRCDIQADSLLSNFANVRKIKEE